MHESFVELCKNSSQSLGDCVGRKLAEWLEITQQKTE